MLSNKVRRKALRDSGITLQQILDFARAMDATDSHMTEMEEPNMNTDRLDAVRKRSNYKPQLSEKKMFDQPKKVFSQTKPYKSRKSCYRCGTVEIIRTLNSVLLLDKNMKDISHGIGTYKGGVVKLRIDESVKPTAQPHRRIPFHMRKKVEKELQRLEDCDVI